MPILTLTMNPCIDKSSSIENVVAERKLRCEEPVYEPGGGGVNVSRAIHKLGGTSTLIYLSGGQIGRMLDMLLDQEGIVCQRMPIQGMTRENLIMYEKATGQQYRFGMPGPMVVEEEWKQCLGSIRAVNPAPEYMVASGSLPPGTPDDFYGQVARLAKDRHIKLILDTTGEPLRIAVEEGLYMIKPNFRELEALSDTKIDQE
ncbi:MAG TPA: 1-phosphofructokinase family hexose kinase, partial [Desulfobacteraceae bacterium]|nr:1-phosphofructokinase family hexose kinase [Desulfobacteraceae bacterium]